MMVAVLQCVQKIGFPEVPKKKTEKKAPHVLKILLVEDNPGDQRLFMDAVSEARILCQLSFADSGEAALEEIRSQKPDLIFMDVIMPGLSGGDLARKLDEDISTQLIPIIFLTGVFNEAYSKGINVAEKTYPALSKPINAQKLKHIILGFNIATK